MTTNGHRIVTAYVVKPKTQQTLSVSLRGRLIIYLHSTIRRIKQQAHITWRPSQWNLCEVEIRTGEQLIRLH